jgi:hypothetical protein
MGDRVLMQIHSSKTGEFGPVVYGHWSGGKAVEICESLKQKMNTRQGDVSYSSARLVQLMIQLSGVADENTSVGIWNTEKKLTNADSHGDEGVFLIDCDNNHSYEQIGN